ncbi:hypothetical protein VTO42DRAFT_9025 [Malbranchea cinnamomea]
MDYTTPPFPGLYPLVPLVSLRESNYLFYIEDIVKFTVLWTLILYSGAHLVAALCAVIMQWRNLKLLWAVPVVYMVVAALEAMLAGSVVGIVLGVIYEAGKFKMSTWIPFVWGCVNTLVLILSSFSIQGGL